MQLEILVLLKDDAGKPLAVGPLAERFREMMATFLGPAMASLETAFAYLTELPAPELTAPLSAAALDALDEAVDASQETPAPALELATAEPPSLDPDGAVADGSSFAPGAVVRVNVPGSPLHNARLRLRGKLDVLGPPQWTAEILEGPDAGGGTAIFESCCAPE